MTKSKAWRFCARLKVRAWGLYCRNKFWFVSSTLVIDRLINVEFAFHPFEWRLSYRDYGSKLVNIGPFCVNWSTY